MNFMPEICFTIIHVFKNLICIVIPSDKDLGHPLDNLMKFLSNSLCNFNFRLKIDPVTVVDFFLKTRIFVRIAFFPAVTGPMIKF